MISPALASILRSGRADFNARFAAARHLHPNLDACAFSEFLQTAVDELGSGTTSSPEHAGQRGWLAHSPPKLR
jgi:hypothetical protein